MSMEKYGVSSEYNEGCEAFYQGKSVAECPYPDGNERQKWKDGWYDTMESERIKKANSS